ncbi:uncharacterized protein LOC132949458 isoform X1 [Metopolophium dirhodum]|uniref:uncharacterized protein LOC132949458 isoform X1 n=2 Tax=Metopolophium dirhodum TaxID=44670 RepID=UPI0029904CF1|nr:uncharacterized protein LOC132949458 isoform X1 [Metopolophium dirhodum]XP_060876340.1 uncharacterized protein LOC132949458 isoform X1 [Metopolophium dirhodum]XP_060876342.1 uncharacterized protein LOC132949458 isoform X1 [Metopolophium dirhodum]XP_060876343.1 uncharacterized protein LOC132949458 isoform X1 [Metopolophium dirhodum]
MINVYSMDDETDLGESLASNQDCSPNSSSSLSKSDVMSGNQMIDNWLGLSVHCTTSIEDFCDGDLEQPDTDPSPSNSGLSYDLTAFPKTTSAMTMFYPHLNGYDIHPLLLNQRRRNQMESSFIDPLNLPPHPLMPDVPRQMIHKNKVRPKVSHRRSDFTNAQSSDFEQPLIVDTEKYHRKSFYCVACSKTFKFQTSLLRHNNKVHISKYQCQSCHRVFSRQAYLDVHTSKQGSSCYLGNEYGIAKSKK